MRYQTDPGPAARLGLIVLSTDETLEDEARATLGQAVSVFHSRIACAPDVTPDNLRAMEGRMVEAARLLPEGLSAIGYGCTSASVVIGPDAVTRQMQVTHPGVPVTNPISAVLAALEMLKARKIALVTPYAADVVAPMRAFLERHDVTIISERSFGERDDRRVARISQTSTKEAILAAGRAPGVEAVFASCTNLRSFGIIDASENELGLPVVSSNSALLWHLQHLAGVAGPNGPGRLLGTSKD